jgi:hypothetical protein
LSSLLSHLQVSAIGREPPKRGFGSGAPRVGDGGVRGPAGDLQRSDAEVNTLSLADTRQKPPGGDNDGEMAQIIWRLVNVHLREVLPLDLSHARSAAYPWLRSDGTGQSGSWTECRFSSPMSLSHIACRLNIACDMLVVTPIDEWHLPRAICHQDLGRCAEGMNGLVNAGRPGGNIARNSLRCQLSLGTRDTYRWETATDAQVAAYPG